MPSSARRAKISVTVDRGLLQAVDSYVEDHEGVDRGKVIDQALLAWYAARQDEAMIEQYTGPTSQEDAEYEAWERIRDAAAADMLRSSPRDG